MSDTVLGESRFVEIFRMVNQESVRHLPDRNTTQNALATQAAVSYIFVYVVPLNLKLFSSEMIMALDFEKLLGADAQLLLQHKCTTIPKESLHLPGPDFIDNVVALSDRPIPVLKSLQALFDHGRLAKTG